MGAVKVVMSRPPARGAGTACPLTWQPARPDMPTATEAEGQAARVFRNQKGSSQAAELRLHLALEGRVASIKRFGAVDS